jgi:transketolase C-terminal domain/subunit
VEFVGIPDSFGISAQGYDELLAHFKLTSDEIARTAKALLKGKEKCVSVL